MVNNEQSNGDYQHQSWDINSWHKIGALALGASVLFGMNAATHFSENIFSEDGVVSLALSVVSLKVGAKALLISHQHHKNNDSRTAGLEFPEND